MTDNKESINPDDEFDYDGSDIDIVSFLTDTDKKGVPLDWYPVRQQLIDKGALAIDCLFEYYQKHNTKFDAWTNFLLASSPFTREELGEPVNKQELRKLQKKVKKLMKNHKENQQDNFNQLLHQT